FARVPLGVVGESPLSSGRGHRKSRSWSVALLVEQGKVTVSHRGGRRARPVRTLSHVHTGGAYVVALFGAAATGARLVIARRHPEPRPGWATIALFAFVAVPSVVGLAIPPVRHALERDADRIGDGQLWRLVSALVQQDGGVPGTVFNLVSLLLIGSVSERHSVQGERSRGHHLADRLRSHRADGRRREEDRRAREEGRGLGLIAACRRRPSSERHRPALRATHRRRA